MPPISVSGRANAAKPSDMLPGTIEHSSTSPDPTHTEADTKSSTKSTAPSDPEGNVDPQRDRHLQLLQHTDGLDNLNEISTAPVFTEPVRRHACSAAASAGSTEQPFTQYGLLAASVGGASEVSPDAESRIFFNVAAPSSVFICGSQGSGKSHTLSCLLENCLIPSAANELPRPLTGIIFHYDTFVSDHGGEPCEAAFLSSNPSIAVRVLCSPTNVKTTKQIYSRLPNVIVRPLRIGEADLNTKRMLDLMAVTNGANGAVPLYLHVVQRILRDMRLTQQAKGTAFSYSTFKSLIDTEGLLPLQLAPLKQRLDTLESFMAKKGAAFGAPGNDWTPKAGQLTIVDLSCPCVTADMACSLFNICLSLFLEQRSDIGRVIALDEAHKYMTESNESTVLTNSLLATIRLQRHQGARIIISTQEPTISPALLDLCSVTIVHRFTSPSWLKSLREHLAGVSSASMFLKKADSLSATGLGEDASAEELVEGVQALALQMQDPALEIFSNIVNLRVGEALLFAPSAIVGIGNAGAIRRLSHGVLKVRIRNRVTEDGGRSIMAV